MKQSQFTHMPCGEAFSEFSENHFAQTGRAKGGQLVDDCVGKQLLFWVWRKSDVMTITEDIFFDALISAFKSKWIESERLLHDPTFKNFAIDEIWKEQIV